MKNLGCCQYCGGPIVETENTYECEYNDGCYHSVIWKDCLRKLGGMSLDKRDALMLISGQEIHVQLKSKKTNRFYYAWAYYENGGVNIRFK